MQKTLRYVMAAVGLISAAPQAWSGTVVYPIFVDTSSISGVNGYLDFQFNSGPGDPILGSAEVLNFSGGGGTLNLADLFVQGVVTGDLPGTVTLYNFLQAVNEYSPAFTYGAFVSFDLSLFWLDPVTPPESAATFYFTMYDGSFNKLLSSAPDPFTQALQADINPDGSTAYAEYPPAVSGEVPEPGTAGLAAAAILALLWRRARR
jgi:hypothetical protein